MTATQRSLALAKVSDDKLTHEELLKRNKNRRQRAQDLRISVPVRKRELLAEKKATHCVPRPYCVLMYPLRCITVKFCDNRPNVVN